MAPDMEDLKTMWLDLKARVDQLAGERQQYLDFFEQSPAAYVVTDPAGTIVEANGAAVDILQRRKRYLRGKPFSVLVALDHRATFRTRLRELADGTGARPFTTIVVAAETRVELALNARLMGRPGAAAGICWRLESAQ